MLIRSIITPARNISPKVNLRLASSVLCITPQHIIQITCKAMGSIPRNTHEYKMLPNSWIKQMKHNCTQSVFLAQIGCLQKEKSPDSLNQITDVLSPQAQFFLPTRSADILTRPKETRILTECHTMVRNEGCSSSLCLQVSFHSV